MAANGPRNKGGKRVTRSGVWALREERRGFLRGRIQAVQRCPCMDHGTLRGDRWMAFESNSSQRGGNVRKECYRTNSESQEDDEKKSDRRKELGTFLSRESIADKKAKERKLK